MTLNGVMALVLRYLRYFTEFGSFQDALRKIGFTIYINFLRRRCSPKHLGFNDISLTMI